MNVIISLLFIVAVAYGYIANIVSLMTVSEVWVVSIARILGIFFVPLGVFIGYF
jgi:hypothetical protein